MELFEFEMQYVYIKSTRYQEKQEEQKFIYEKPYFLNLKSLQWLVFAWCPFKGHQQWVIPTRNKNVELQLCTIIPLEPTR